MTQLNLDEPKIVNMYDIEQYTLRDLAERFGTDHHTIRRLLVRNGVEITRRRTRKPFTEEHRRKLSESHRGLPTWVKGKKMPENANRKNMVAHLNKGVTLSDLEKYTDFDKLKFLNGVLSRYSKDTSFNLRGPYIAYLDKFYFDDQFNKLYSDWLRSGKNKWYMPSMDHKTSKSNGGDTELSNIQFITWFENRAKAEMNVDEWEAFKKLTNTTSDLFSTPPRREPPTKREE